MMYCPNGFVKDSNGCEECMCARAEEAVAKHVAWSHGDSTTKSDSTYFGPKAMAQAKTEQAVGGSVKCSDAVINYGNCWECFGSKGAPCQAKYGGKQEFGEGVCTGDDSSWWDYKCMKATGKTAGEVSVGDDDDEEGECNYCEDRMQNGDCKRIEGCLLPEEIDALPTDQKNCVMSYSGDISRPHTKDRHGVTKDDWCRTSGGWMRCGGGALCCSSGLVPSLYGWRYKCSSADAVFMTTPEGRPHNVVVYGFAAVGLAALFYGAGRHFFASPKHTVDIEL